MNPLTRWLRRRRLLRDAEALEREVWRMEALWEVGVLGIENEARVMMGLALLRGDIDRFAAINNAVVKAHEEFPNGSNRAAELRSEARKLREEARRLC